MPYLNVFNICYCWLVTWHKSCLQSYGVFRHSYFPELFRTYLAQKHRFPVSFCFLFPPATPVRARRPVPQLRPPPPLGPGPSRQTRPHPGPGPGFSRLPPGDAVSALFLRAPRQRPLPPRRLRAGFIPFISGSGALRAALPQEPSWRVVSEDRGFQSVGGGGVYKKRNGRCFGKGTERRKGEREKEKTKTTNYEKMAGSCWLELSLGREPPSWPVHTFVPQLFPVRLYNLHPI